MALEKTARLAWTKEDFIKLEKTLENMREYEKYCVQDVTVLEHILPKRLINDTGIYDI